MTRRGGMKLQGPGRPGVKASSSGQCGCNSREKPGGDFSV